MQEQALHGGCLCGAVRYRVLGQPSIVTLCHCSMCRRSVGAQSVTWATFARQALSIAGEALSWHRSSPRAQRAFCSACGSSLLFTSDAHPDEIDLTVGSLDDPALCPPSCHIFVADKLPWVALEPQLPRHLADSSSPRIA